MVLGIAHVLLKIAADGRLQKSASYQLSLSYLISDTHGKLFISMQLCYRSIPFFCIFFSPSLYSFKYVGLTGLESKVSLNIHRIDVLQTEGVPDCLQHFCHQKVIREGYRNKFGVPVLWSLRCLKRNVSHKDPKKQKYVELVRDCKTRNCNGKDAFYFNMYLHFC